MTKYIRISPTNHYLNFKPSPNPQFEIRVLNLKSKSNAKAKTESNPNLNLKSIKNIYGRSQIHRGLHFYPFTVSLFPNFNFVSL